MKRVRTPLTLFTLRGVLPPPTPDQVVRHLRLGVILRWLVIAVVATGAMLSPRIPPPLLPFLVGCAVYNSTIWFVVGRSTPAWWRRIAFAVTLADQLICFSFLAVYATVMPGGEVLGGYLIATIEAIVYFGASGAALSVGVFLACSVLLQFFDPPLFSRTFNAAGIGGAFLMIGALAAILVCAVRIVVLQATATDSSLIVEPVSSPAEALNVHLSRREQEVLHLVAEGYTTTMIARKLRLRDTTVKSYVENLLVRLDVRNRAEAVAEAARRGLI